MCLQVPLYIISAPLRLFNAFYYNIIIHATFETFNYWEELFDPRDRKPGAKGVMLWTLELPRRFVVYICFHWPITIVESILFTAIDTIWPALTLYHGTSFDAAEKIVSDPERNFRQRETSSEGLWMVGGGNYAGDGIYFAPAYSTAKHYAQGRGSDCVIIVARVTLGKVLNLGLADRWLFNQCGSPKATGVSSYGLKHGYTTGEWWRPDKKWWEYCLYDYGNRYNYTWRIRPLYLERPHDHSHQRVHGGMSHWFFRQIVVKDMKASITS